MRVLLCLPAVLALVFPLESAAVPPQCQEPFDVVLNEQYSGITQGQTQLIDNEQDFCDAWDEIYGIVFPAPACDTTLVDFNTEVAVLVALGSRGSGCYSVDMGCVARSPTDRVMAVSVETEPSPACICTLAIVDPVVIATVALPVTDLTMKQVVRQLSCP